MRRNRNELLSFTILQVIFFVSVRSWQIPLKQSVARKGGYFPPSPKQRYPENNEHLTRRNILLDGLKKSSSLLAPSLFLTEITTKPCLAITSDEAASSYNRYAKQYDLLDGGIIAQDLGIASARSKLISQARGNVLEIGAGTGLNLKEYVFASSPSEANGVTSLTLLDISDGMLGEAKDKLKDLNIPSFVQIDFVNADATSEIIKKFGDDKFDTVVDTFSLCVMGTKGAENCLRQIEGAVKGKEEGGKVLMIENTRSSNSLLGRYQDLTADMAANLGGKGCVSNQDVTAMIEKTNRLDILSEEEFASGVFRSFIVLKSS